MGIKIGFIEDALDRIEEKYGKAGKEVAKQAIDQPLHILMAVASVWAIGWPMVYFMGSPIWLAAALAGTATAAWMGVREYLQWPSSRWWDPYLDWFFEAGGLALGLWSLIAALG